MSRRATSHKGRRTLESSTLHGCWHVLYCSQDCREKDRLHKLVCKTFAEYDLSQKPEGNTTAIISPAMDHSLASTPKTTLFSVKTSEETEKDGPTIDERAILEVLGFKSAKQIKGQVKIEGGSDNSSYLFVLFYVDLNATSTPSLNEITLGFSSQNRWLGPMLVMIGKPNPTRFQDVTAHNMCLIRKFFRTNGPDGS